MWVIKFILHRELTGDVVMTKTHKYTSKEKAQEACDRYNNKGSEPRYWVEKMSDDCKNNGENV